ncbi:MAG: hypothetical protein IH983_04865 [Planctomycetes bacterium]|nr:hypothetical protein [Planctomycetota bacterium]
MTDPSSERPFTLVWGWLFAAHGVYQIIAAIALAGLSWLLPGLLEKIASSALLDPADVPPAVQRLLANRAWLPLWALPGFVLGWLLMLKVRYRWLWMLLGVLSLLLPAMLLVYAFVALIAPLYQYRPL